jgi:4-carboxymuconolactone decarboxylase
MFSFCLFAGGSAVAGQASTEGAKTMSKSEDIRAVAPALEGYAQKYVHGDLWKRPGLSSRDRSIVTVAALIARDQTAELPYYLGLSLDNGVKPSEISEIITHLAFYTGWANAIDAIPAAKEVFESRNIGADQLPPASGPLLPLDETAEKQRPRASESSLDRSRQALCSTRPTCCSGISGSGRRWLRATAAWLP